MIPWHRTCECLIFCACVLWGAAIEPANSQQPTTDTLRIGPHWQYRRQVSLEPPTPKPDYPVSVTLTPEAMGRSYADVKLDGSDLRFTGPDGRTLLNYWIEQWHPRGDSKIWVNVPEAGTRTLYLYYGNSAAKAASDGESTFDFFDDFNDGIWKKYAGNPVIVCSQRWEKYTMEPSIIYDDGVFKLWYSGGDDLGYATSRDGFHWTKYPHTRCSRSARGK